MINKPITLDGGKLGTTGNADGTTNTISGAINLTSSGGTLEVGTTTTGSGIIISGAIGGTGKLTKTGGGSAILTGTNNNWTGGIEINRGILQFGDGGANASVPSTGDIAINSPQENLNIDWFAVNSSNDVVINNKITGTGGDFQKLGSGTVTLGNAANDFLARVVVKSGAVKVTTNNSLGSSIFGGPTGDTPYYGATGIAGTTWAGTLIFDGTAGNLSIGEYIYMDARQNTSDHIRNAAGDNTLRANYMGITAGSGTAATAQQYNLEALPGSKLTINSTITYVGSSDRNATIFFGGGGAFDFGGKFGRGDTGSTATFTINVQPNTKLTITSTGSISPVE